MSDHKKIKWLKHPRLKFAQLGVHPQASLLVRPAMTVADEEEHGLRGEWFWAMDAYATGFAATEQEAKAAAIAAAPAGKPDPRDAHIATLKAALTNCLEIFGDAEWEYGDGTPFDVKAVRAALGGSTTLAAHDAEVRWAALEEAAGICAALAVWTGMTPEKALGARECADHLDARARALAEKERDAARAALRRAKQLAEVASDWNLNNVEIDKEMVSIYDLRDEFAAHGGDDE